MTPQQKEVRKQFAAAFAAADAILNLSDFELTPILFQSWYEHAQAAIESGLGPQWRDLVVWEAFAPANGWKHYRERLSKAVSFLETAEMLLPDRVEPTNPADHRREARRPVSGIRTFIVHGHDQQSKLELKNYLQNTLQLPQPIILHEQPNHGRTILEKLETYANQATYAFVLLTPDDKAHTSAGTEVYRSRQNVILELGYFLGRFGRETGRVIVLHKGTLDIPSDISGLAYIPIDSGIEAAGEAIRREIRQLTASA